MGDVDGGVEVLQGFKASKPRLRSGSRVCDQACFCFQEYPAVEGIKDLASVIRHPWFQGYLPCLSCAK